MRVKWLPRVVAWSRSSFWRFWTVKRLWAIVESGTFVLTSVFLRTCASNRTPITAFRNTTKSRDRQLSSVILCWGCLPLCVLTRSLRALVPSVLHPGTFSLHFLQYRQQFSVMMIHPYHRPVRKLLRHGLSTNPERGCVGRKVAPHVETRCTTSWENTSRFTPTLPSEILLFVLTLYLVSSYNRTGVMEWTICIRLSEIASGWVKSTILSTRRRCFPISGTWAGRYHKNYNIRDNMVLLCM